MPGDWLPHLALALPNVDISAPVAEATRSELRRALWERVSLRRDELGLRSAAEDLRALAARGPVDPETANMLFAAQAIVACALARRESRGGHYRDDYPDRDPALDGRHTLLRPVTMHAVPTRVAREAAHA